MDATVFLVFVLLTFPGCFGGLLHSPASQRWSNQGQGQDASILPSFNSADYHGNVNSNRNLLETGNTNVIPDSSMVENVPTGSSSIPEMFANFLDSGSTNEGNEIDYVPLTMGPFNIYLRPVRERMPLTTMAFASHEFSFPISKEERFNSSYTPFSILYPEPKSYRSGDLPTIEDVYNNPKLIKGFEQAHAHPANRAVALKFIEVGKNALRVVRFVPKLRALEVGEPGIPIEISELPITISGYPYGDSTFVLPACKFMMPYPGAA